ncbi:MAG TPA: hypothetical protein VIG40_07320 [Tissierellaceae bacterium]
MYKVIVDTKSNLKNIAEASEQKGRYKKIVTEVASELAVVVKSKAPVKKKLFSSGRKQGGKRIKQKSGNLKDSIGVFDSNSQNYVRVWVGARVRDGYDGWYAQMVHDGHKVYRNLNSLKRNPLKRWRNKRISEKTQGYVKADPFITNSYNAKKSSLEASLTSKIGTNLETLIKQNNNA